MAKRKKQTTRSKTKTTRARSRRVSRPSVAHGIGFAVGRYFLPLAAIVVLLGATVFIAASGYDTFARSSFFSLRNVDVRGVDRTPADDIKRVVSSSVEKTGVWNADLAEIRVAVEKFPFIKTAAVSRMLPGGIRVNVTERTPVAVVKLSSGNYLVDGEAAVLALANEKNNDLPFVLQGWDESKTEKAVTENLNRLKVYKKMLDEWKQFDLASRVKRVDLSNPRDPVAVIEDSGNQIAVTLGKENLGKSLKSAIEAASGKGGKLKGINAEGVFPVLQYNE
jgi:cell division septal protein FtsQ